MASPRSQAALWAASAAADGDANRRMSTKGREAGKEVYYSDRRNDRRKTLIRLCSPSSPCAGSRRRVLFRHFSPRRARCDALLRLAMFASSGLAHRFLITASALALWSAGVSEAHAASPRIYHQQAVTSTTTSGTLEALIDSSLAQSLQPFTRPAGNTKLAISSDRLALEEPWVARGLREVYRDRGYRPIFVEGRQLTRSGEALVAALQDLERHGIARAQILDAETDARLQALLQPSGHTAIHTLIAPPEQLRMDVEQELAMQIVQHPFLLQQAGWYRSAKAQLTQTFEQKLRHADPAQLAELQVPEHDAHELEWGLALALVRYARALKLDNPFAAPGNPALNEAREHLDLRGYGDDTTGSMTSAPPIPAHIREVTRSMDQWQLDELDTLLAAADGQRDLPQALQAFAPASAEYVGLQNELLRYEKIAERGGWSSVEAFGPLASADETQLNSLTRRLQAEEYLAVTPEATRTTPTLEELHVALIRWKAHHGLDDQATVDQSTRDAFAVSVQERIAQLSLALEKIRRARYAFDAANRHIRVNIPAFQAGYWESGEEQFQWRVIVGKTQGAGQNHTPEMSALLTEIELNPFWYPPRRLMRDTSATGRVVRPGPNNPMGRAKFIFPNEDAIYMHDTNRRALFSETHRAFSAGCIRVDRAEYLATEMIARDRGQPHLVAQAFVERRLRGRTRYRYYLQEPLPVHIEYRTAYLSSEGRAIFALDLYGIDRAAMDERMLTIAARYPSLHRERRHDRYLRSFRPQSTTSAKTAEVQNHAENF